MTDRAGDPTKRPPECNKAKSPTDCPNLVDVTPSSFVCETYRCDVCGEYFKLYYDDMQ